MNDIYMVVDDENKVAAIQLTVLGREATLCAIFHNEEDALEFLWACQDQLVRPHKVSKVSNMLITIKE